MEKPKTSNQLKQLILIKEAERITDGRIIRQEFQQTFNGLKPASLIQTVLPKISTVLPKISASGDLKTIAVKAIVGFVADWIVKKILQKRLKISENKAVTGDGGGVEKIIDEVMDRHSIEIKALLRLMLKQAADKSVT